MSSMPEWVAEHLARREAGRTKAASKMLESLSPRNRKLVREAAIMGYVLGTRNADGALPGDDAIVTCVLIEAMKNGDLYPAINRLSKLDQD